MEFFFALTDPDLPFLKNALWAGLLASLAFGLIGSYIVARRISYMAGAISHSSLAGIGAGLWAEAVFGVKAGLPLWGALIAAMAAAWVIGTASLRAREREDSIIGSIWALGMAIGLIFIAKTPGYVDAMSYLFGDILLIGKSDIIAIVILDVIVLGLGVYFYHQISAISFDAEFARIRGSRVDFYFILLLQLTAMTVVALVRIVGIVMVVAMLTIPAAIAGRFTNRLWKMALVAIFLNIIFLILGLWASYVLDLPSGTTIIIIAGLTYLALLAFTPRRGKGFKGG